LALDTPEMLNGTVKKILERKNLSSNKLTRTGFLRETARGTENQGLKGKITKKIQTSPSKGQECLNLGERLRQGGPKINRLPDEKVQGRDTILIVLEERSEGESISQVNNKLDNISKKKPE